MIIKISRSNQDTVETIYASGKVTGNIENLEVTSLQNKSTTTGSSSGVNIGLTSSGIPSSLNISGTSTDGNRAYVDNQSTFIAGEGSNLSIGKAANTGAVIGTEGTGVVKIGEYTGKDINNYDTMRTTGGSIGLQTGNVPLSNIGYSQESRDREGVSRNTVVGNVEIGKSSGDEINRDISKANEVTRDVSKTTNINVESQTIEYAVNPDKLKEDIGKAKQEIADVTRAFKESVNDRGDDNRNFFGQLSEVRLNETIDNIAGERLDRASTQEDIKDTLEAAYKDLGYDVEIRFSTSSETPELNGKGGTAYVGDDGKHTVIINSGYLNGKTKGEILGVISEEASHVINGAEGRQIATGTEEKGLESTGRATNEYFKDKYKDDDTTISLTSEGAIDTSKLGTNVGDKVIASKLENEAKYNEWKSAQMAQFYLRSINYLKDKNGKYYDEELVNFIAEGLTKLYNNGEILREINDSDEIFKILTDNYKESTKERGNGISENINFSSEDNIVMNKETGYLEIIGDRKETSDLLTLASRGMIDDPNQTTVFKIIDTEISPKQEEFLKNLEEKIKNSKLPKDKQEEYLQKHREIWNNMFEDGNITVNPGDLSFLVVKILPKNNTEIYVSEKNEKGFIERVVTSESTVSSKIAHEGAGHTTDRSSRRNDMFEEIRKKGIKIYEDSQTGMIYSSDRYEIEGNEVFFYPTKSEEFLSIRMENEIYKKTGKKERIYYNKDDAVNFKRIRFSGKNPDLNKLFDKAMKEGK